ncbi:MAG: J domain-containing protein [Alphaproteobacteria bacterium]|nr:MAG: J domain-containing protein [Alphaproteobacteria bacterium]
MTRRPRDFGFPRWGGYLKERDPVRVRLCDREGCTERGEYPAPRSPFSRERWYFCRRHVEEYNRGWNFFAGMSEEAIRAFMADEQAARRGYRQSATYAYAADSWTPAEKAAYRTLGLEPGADLEEVKQRYRALAKQHHPDVAGSDDPEVRERFVRIQAAYSMLCARLGEREAGDR